MPPALPSKYSVELATDRRQDASFLASWNEFLKDSESEDKIYQTPEFFNFLLRTSNGKDRMEIYSISSREDGKLVGMVPVRIRSDAFVFQIGTKKLASRQMRVIGLLGSMPMAPAEPDLAAQIVDYLFQQFHECQALCLSALPAASVFWNSLRKSSAMSENFRTCIIDEWRECHTIPLFSSFELYLRQFSTKKRYNLNRQIRLLREHGGSLSLHRIRTAAEVHRLTSAIQQLLPADGRGIFLSEEKCKALADLNLLHCYVLECGQAPAAFIFGTCSRQVLHIHNIMYSSTLPEFSIGTTILHLAIEDLCTAFNFSSIDLGYGVPGHTYQSSNVKRERAYVLIFPNTLTNRCLCWLHDFQDHAIKKAKAGMKNIRRLIKTFRAPA